MINRTNEKYKASTQTRLSGKSAKPIEYPMLVSFSDSNLHSTQFPVPKTPKNYISPAHLKLKEKYLRMKIFQEQ